MRKHLHNVVKVCMILNIFMLVMYLGSDPLGLGNLIEWLFREHFGILFGGLCAFAGITWWSFDKACRKRRD